jgi:beta-phosphoglucomutase
MFTPAVIFDMDGVLVDSSEAHFRAWAAVGAEIGVSYTRELFDRTFGMHNRQTIPLWLGRSVPDEEIRGLALRKESHYREEARQSLRAIPGAVDLVNRLAQNGFRLAVGSSGPAANISLGLELLGISSYFHGLSSGDQVKEGKPHPAIFLNAAKVLNVEPSACIVIEDAPQGVEAAHRAGMKAVALPTSRPPDALAAADWVVAGHEDITPDALRRLLSI